MIGGKFLQNNNGQFFGDRNISKIIAIIVTSLVIISVGILLIRSLIPKSEYDRNIEQATSAARQHMPNAQVRDLKISNGFALAVVYDPSASGQTASGSMTIFKVNSDKTMTQLAQASSFNPVDMIGYGIPLTTQAKLTDSEVEEVRQNLFDSCGYYEYEENTPGYLGFKGSFDPDGWQIDANTFEGIYVALNTKLILDNSKASSDNKIICVNAIRSGSSASTDTSTSISNFSLTLQLISSNGELTNHPFSFAIGPNRYHSYTLDGKSI